MGNSKSKRLKEKDDKFFDRERRKELINEEKKKIRVNPIHKRIGIVEPPVTPATLASTPPPPPAAIAGPSINLRTYDDEALDLMRYQLHYDSDAFLLNNILLSVQFFSNFEKEQEHIKNNPIGDREHAINNAMVQHHKHVFFADRMQDSLHKHLSFQKTDTQSEPLVVPRLFVIYDNIEASEPGDSADYSTVLDAPVYKLCIEDSKEPGYVRLQKLEVLKGPTTQPNDLTSTQKTDSDDSVYTDSEKESVISDDFSESNRKEFIDMLKNKLNDLKPKEGFSKKKNFTINNDPVEGRRASGPIKQISLQAQKSSISNINNYNKASHTVQEDNEKDDQSTIEETKDVYNKNEKSRKHFLKNNINTRRLSGPVREFKTKIITIDTISEDTETSGYRSNSGSRQNEFSESESDYGYATINESTTPKKIELSLPSNKSLTSGVLPDELWSAEDIRLDNWSDNEDDESEFDPNMLDSRNLYETKYYLNSLRFMRNFVDIFITNLGSCLELPADVVNNALTQGASVYCDTLKNGQVVGSEIYPAIVAAWPNAANQFVIRERKIIQNPRTNFSYQWPTKQMVHRAIELGCFLVPIGFRAKRGQNPEQIMQWRVIFPAAERYLEKFLAHSHVRCYLFALTLQKTFMENESSKVGLEASHIKNHLFWQCEDNFAKWPEDRLGETLRTFLQNFYIRFGQKRLPNYFMNNCNELKSIPKPVMLKLQRKLADILEAPVTHVLYALSKLNYHNKDFYPKFNVHRLYEILTCKNPLRLVNPSIPVSVLRTSDGSDVEEENGSDLWDRAKVQDKQYLWKKQRQKKQMEAKRKALYSSKQKAALREKEMNPNIKLPLKMEQERRRLVLEFFIPHFIAMSRSSEKFEAIGQAIIYLEQAQRLCILLQSEPMGESTAKEYLDVIRDKLADCQRKLAKQDGYKLPLRRESNLERPPRKHKKNRPRFDKNHSNSPTDNHGIAAFTFVADVHHEDQKKNGTLKFNEIDAEESKL